MCPPGEENFPEMILIPRLSSQFLQSDLVNHWPAHFHSQLAWFPSDARTTEMQHSQVAETDLNIIHKS